MLLHYFAVNNAAFAIRIISPAIIPSHVLYSLCFSTNCHAKCESVFSVDADPEDSNLIGKKTGTRSLYLENVSPNFADKNFSSFCIVNLYIYINAAKKSKKSNTLLVITLNPA